MAFSTIRHVTVPGLRIHLRRGDPSMLWLNGKDLVMVNDTAADFIESFIEVMRRHEHDLDPKRFKREVAERMRLYYPDAPVKVLVRDFDNLYRSLLDISSGACPVHDLNLDTRETGPASWTAPPRMDLALTYRCNNDCSFCYSGGSREITELGEEDWIRIIDKLWNNGVPQIVFTGGEPTLREDLVELIENSKEFVTGLVTNGRNLADLAKKLDDAELDYIQVSLESHIPGVHDRMVGRQGAWQETVDGIRAALDLGMSVLTNTTLTRDNLALFPDMIRYGAKMGLRMMACNTLICSGKIRRVDKQKQVSLDALKDILISAADIARSLDIKLEWYSPTCYKQFNPVEFGFGAKCCSAAQYNMTVEPDGSVIPCQSWFQDKLGNLTTSQWPEIWEHPVAKGFREKAYLKGRTECENCEYLPQCWGGCPLEYLPSSPSSASD